MEIQQWYDTEFMPWKEQVRDREERKKHAISLVMAHAAELKYIMALLLEKREAEALKIWNNLGLQPPLSGLKMDPLKDLLMMTTVDERTLELPLDALLDDLQKMLSGA